MSITKVGLGVLLVVLGAGMTAAAYRENPSTAGGQDLGYLDRRISSLEQRLHSIESSIRRLEQSALTQRPSPGSTPTGRDPEVGLLRSEVEILKNRVREVECGLVHLDERTLPTREGRGRPGAPAKDPCRLNPEAPVRLSTRP